MLAVRQALGQGISCHFAFDGPMCRAGVAIGSAAAWWAGRDLRLRCAVGHSGRCAREIRLSQQGSTEGTAGGGLLRGDAVELGVVFGSRCWSAGTSGSALSRESPRVMHMHRVACTSPPAVSLQHARHGSLRAAAVGLVVQVGHLGGIALWQRQRNSQHAKNPVQL
mmetsp:Transcript_25109/g.57021  ORF Transcript_25109/g.57021 Transcript_25109/m.57021 type:complete len:166 (+) Transcript_25109:420-917(+)